VKTELTIKLRDQLGGAFVKTLSQEDKDLIVQSVIEGALDDVDGTWTFRRSIQAAMEEKFKEWDKDVQEATAAALETKKEEIIKGVVKGAKDKLTKAFNDRYY
jgi:hypothetical protein